MSGQVASNNGIGDAFSSFFKSVGKSLEKGVSEVFETGLPIWANDQLGVDYPKLQKPTFNQRGSGGTNPQFVQSNNMTAVLIVGGIIAAVLIANN